MASTLFKQAPQGMTLEELRDAMSAVADEVEKERTKAAEAARERKEPYITHARVYVGPVLIDPRNNSESFLVSYSDEDKEAPRRVDALLRAVGPQKPKRKRNKGRRQHGDPYLV